LQNPYQEKIINLHPETYEEAKQLAVKMEKYNHNREYISKSTINTVTERINKLIGNEAKGIPAFSGATAICCIGEGHISNMDRIDRIETSITELTRVIQTLVEERRNPVQRRSPPINTSQNRSGENQSRSITPHKCFIYDQEGHIARDCYGKNSTHEKEYFMVHVDEDEELFDIRNPAKRRQLDVGVTTRASKRRKSEELVNPAKTNNNK
ncbi:20117_t:CDS:2, partial [Gigaspora rosea]